MRMLKAIQTFEIEGEIYKFNEFAKGGFKIGTILYDIRKEAFLEVETQEDLNNLSYLAPEMYVKLEKI